MNNLDGVKIGVFDSGIGGFSILKNLFERMPFAHYFYYSDDAYAPYGPKTDNEITERAKVITEELILQKVDMIVVACNTATAASIDALRETYPELIFVGVEPYLKAYEKIIKEEKGEAKVAVLTTEATGRSHRYQKLKERLDPFHHIKSFPLPHLARLIEDFYYDRLSAEAFLKAVEAEFSFLNDKGLTHLILGCTHYPLIAKVIQKITHAKTLAPCPFVAQRAYDLLLIKYNKECDQKLLTEFQFFSSRTNHWEKKSRIDFLFPYIQEGEFLCQK